MHLGRLGQTGVGAEVIDGNSARWEGLWKRAASHMLHIMVFFYYYYGGSQSKDWCMGPMNVCRRFSTSCTVFSRPPWFMRGGELFKASITGLGMGYGCTGWLVGICRHV